MLYNLQIVTFLFSFAILQYHDKSHRPHMLRDTKLVSAAMSNHIQPSRIWRFSRSRSVRYSMLDNSYSSMLSYIRDTLMRYIERHFFGELSKLAERRGDNARLTLGLGKWLNSFCIPLLQLLERRSSAEAFISAEVNGLAI